MFVVLAGNVTVEGVRRPSGAATPEPSPLVIAPLVASIVAMAVLAETAHRGGRPLRDNLLLAHAAKTPVCVLSSVSTFSAWGCID